MLPSRTKLSRHVVAHVQKALRKLYSSHATANPQLHQDGRLKGKTCFITGGSRGIGFAIARRFMVEGADKIILVGRDQRTLRRAISDLQEHADAFENACEVESVDRGSDDLERHTEKTRPGSQSPNHIDDEGPKSQNHEGKLHFLAGDISQNDFWETVKKDKLMHDIDILVNAAGVSQSCLIPFYATESIRSLLDTNLYGPIMGSRALVNAAMRAKQQHKHDRCIINVSSLLALKGGAGASVYAATKAGLLGLTRALAQEMGASERNMPIRVNAVVPGYIETAMMSDLGEKLRERALESIPLKRFGTPDEVADATVFLAANEYANNCVLNLDGGLSAT